MQDTYAYGVKGSVEISQCALVGSAIGVSCKLKSARELNIFDFIIFNIFF